MLPLPMGALPESIEPYLALMIAGFVLGVLGHIARSRWMVALGVIMVLLAALIFPFILQLFAEEPPPPGPRVPPVGPGLIFLALAARVQEGRIRACHPDLQGAPAGRPEPRAGRRGRPGGRRARPPRGPGHEPLTRPGHH